MYRVSDQSAPLAYLRVNVETEVSNAHPTMRDMARTRCTAHNAAIDLMLGQGDYVPDWLAPKFDAQGRPVVEPFDPGPFAPALDELCIEMRMSQSPYSPINAEMVRHRVGVIASGDPRHPVARHWRVMRARAGAADQAWPEIEALVPTALDVAAIRAALASGGDPAAVLAQLQILLGSGGGGGPIEPL